MKKVKISFEGAILNEYQGDAPAQNSIISSNKGDRTISLKVCSLVETADSIIVETVQNKQTLNG